MHRTAMRFASFERVGAATLRTARLVFAVLLGAGSGAGPALGANALFHAVAPDTGTDPSLSPDGGFVVGAFPSGHFRWSASTGIVPLPILPHAVSTNGEVVVGFVTEAARWTEDEGATSLGDLSGGNAGGATDVTPDGARIVGYDISPRSVYQAFRWTANEGMVGLGHLPGGAGFGHANAVSADGAVIVGTSDGTRGQRVAFRWTAGAGMEDLGAPAGPFSSSFAHDVSQDGEVIVGLAYEVGHADAFRWTAAEGVQVLRSAPDPFSGAFMSASATNADGSIVVGHGGDSLSSAFLWDPDHGVRILADVLAGLGANVAGWQLGPATDVSASGQVIVGEGVAPDGTRQVWIARLCEAGGVDADGDGVTDECDVCPFSSDPDQQDTGGVGAGSLPDGVGDACQCGDVDGNGRATLADAVVIQRALLVPPTATMSAPELCDADGNGRCTAADAVVVRRALLRPPSARIRQACAPASP